MLLSSLFGEDEYDTMDGGGGRGLAVSLPRKISLRLNEYEEPSEYYWLSKG